MQDIRQTLINVMYNEYKVYENGIVDIIIFYIKELEVGEAHNQKDEYMKCTEVNCGGGCYDEDSHWDYILTKKKLSETFIETFQNDINWVMISSRQILSEQFIEKFKY